LTGEEEDNQALLKMKGRTRRTLIGTPKSTSTSRFVVMDLGSRLATVVR